jgi:hypothetical protein
VEINSTSGRLSEWGPQVATLSWDSYELVAGHPTSLSELENGAVMQIGSRTGAPVYGMAIDLDEFGISPLASVDTVRFGSIARRESIDTALIMGIKPRQALAGASNASSSTAGIPEPTSFALVIIGLACCCKNRAGRRELARQAWQLARDMIAEFPNKELLFTSGSIAEQIQELESLRQNITSAKPPELKSEKSHE